MENMSNEVIELWKDAKKDEVYSAGVAIAGANKTESDFRNLQFVLATFLFTFTSPIFTQKTIIDSNVKLLIFLAWISLFISIITGIIHMIGEIKFYINAAKLHYRKIKIYSTIGTLEEYQEAAEKANALNEELGDIQTSSNIPLILQCVFLLLGFSLIFSAAGIILYK